MEAPWRYLEVWETSSWFSRNYSLRYLAGGLAESRERRDAWCYSGPGWELALIWPLCGHLILSWRSCFHRAFGNDCAQPSESGDEGVNPDSAFNSLQAVDRATRPLWTSVSALVKSVDWTSSSPSPFQFRILRLSSFSAQLAPLPPSGQSVSWDQREGHRVKEDT